MSFKPQHTLHWGYYYSGDSTVNISGLVEVRQSMKYTRKNGPVTEEELDFMLQTLKGMIAHSLNCSVDQIHSELEYPTKEIHFPTKD